MLSTYTMSARPETGCGALLKASGPFHSESGIHLSNHVMFCIFCMDRLSFRGPASRDAESSFFNIGKLIAHTASTCFPECSTSGTLIRIASAIHMCSNASAVESVEQPGLAAPAPELAGLLDDSFATMLEEILVSKNPFGGVQLSDCPEPALLNNLAPGPDSALSLPSFPQQQGPRMPSESEQPDVWSFDKKGNGSGEFLESPSYIMSQ